MERWIAPAKRSIDTDAAGAVRLALARAGASLKDALQAPVHLPHFALTEPVAAPRLAYGLQGAGLLDSFTAFP